MFFSWFSCVRRARVCVRDRLFWHRLCACCTCPRLVCFRTGPCKYNRAHLVTWRMWRSAPIRDIWRQGTASAKLFCIVCCRFQRIESVNVVMLPCLAAQCVPVKSRISPSIAREILLSDTSARRVLCCPSRLGESVRRTSGAKLLSVVAANESVCQVFECVVLRTSISTRAEAGQAAQEGLCVLAGIAVHCRFPLPVPALSVSPYRGI